MVGASGSSTSLLGPVEAAEDAHAPDADAHPGRDDDVDAAEEAEAADRDAFLGNDGLAEVDVRAAEDAERREAARAPARRP